MYLSKRNYGWYSKPSINKETGKEKRGMTDCFKEITELKTKEGRKCGEYNAVFHYKKKKKTQKNFNFLFVSANSVAPILCQYDE